MLPIIDKENASCWSARRAHTECKRHQWVFTHTLLAPVRKQTEVKRKRWLKMIYYEFSFPFVEPSETSDVCFLLIELDF